MPVLTSNYPAAQSGAPTLMSTPERVGALSEYTGKGITLAFIDSGFYPHPDLRGRIVTHIDATTDEITESSFIPKSMAFSWHGMMTSVICAGDGWRSGGKYKGIASGAELVLIKVSSPKNQIKEADILRGLEWVLAHHRRYNIRVVNLSVGGDYVSFDNQHPLHLVIKRLVDHGVIVVAAAGNRPVNHLLPPASSAEAITVGGLDDNNTSDRHEWRLYGHNSGLAYDGSAKPELVAPARWIASPIMPSTPVAWEAFWIGPLLHADARHPVRQLMESGSADKGLTKLFGHAYSENLLSTLQARAYEHKLIDAYHQHVDGTSVAAPIVTSVIAQMLECAPELTPAQVKAILIKTAHPLAGSAVERQGAGILDAAGAVRTVISEGPLANRGTV
ncbi:MAG: S8 family serine peptidase [Chloroflexi bacterium]|nr:S8 family serine peptidase [Chloroflexota bacterium]